MVFALEHFLAEILTLAECSHQASVVGKEIERSSAMLYGYHQSVYELSLSVLVFECLLSEEKSLDYVRFGLGVD